MVGILLVAIFSLSILPGIVRADDSISEADKTAAEQAREQAKKLEERRLEAAKTRQESLKTELERHQEDLKKKSEAEREKAKKEQEAFQKKCEGRREGFKTSLEAINERVKKQLATLDKIDDRVEAYVANNNLTVPNYAEDVLAVKTQRALAHSINEATKKTAEGFDCGTDKGNTQAALLSHKDAVLQQVNAIKDYRTALKKLITDVKSVVPQSENKQGAAQ